MDEHWRSIAMMEILSLKDNGEFPRNAIAARLATTAPSPLRKARERLHCP